MIKLTEFSDAELQQYRQDLIGDITQSPALSALNLGQCTQDDVTPVAVYYEYIRYRRKRENMLLHVLREIHTREMMK